MTLRHIAILVLVAAAVVMAQLPKPGSSGGGGAALVANTDYVQPLFAFTRPTTSGWTSVNTDSAVVSTNSNTRNLRDVDNVDELHYQHRALDSNNWIVEFTEYQTIEANKYPFVFVGYCDTASGKVEGASLQNNSGVNIYGPWANWEKWTNATTRSTGGTALQLTRPPRFFRGTYAGGAGTMTLSQSADGANWETLISESAGTFLTPNAVCFGVRSNSSATQVVSMTLHSLTFY